MLPHCRATSPVRQATVAGKPAPAGARLPERTRCPFGVFRRGLHELTSANTCWEPTECALGSHKRSSGTLAVSFRPFLVRTRKGHVSSLPKEKICAFLTEEKSTKRLTETLSRTLIVLLASAYPRLPTDGTAHLRALSEHELESNLYPLKA